MNETIELKILVANIEVAKKEKKEYKNLFITQSFKLSSEQMKEIKELRKKIKKNQNKINTIIKGL